MFMDDRRCSKPKCVLNGIDRGRVTATAVGRRVAMYVEMKRGVAPETAGGGALVAMTHVNQRLTWNGWSLQAPYFPYMARDLNRTRCARATPVRPHSRPPQHVHVRAAHQAEPHLGRRFAAANLSTSGYFEHFVSWSFFCFRIPGGIPAFRFPRRWQDPCGPDRRRSEGAGPKSHRVWCQEMHPAPQTWWEDIIWSVFAHLPGGLMHFQTYHLALVLISCWQLLHILFNYKTICELS